MESGLASRTIPMDRHRFSFPRPNRFEVSTHIKNKDYIAVKKISEKSIPPRRLVNSYRIVSDAVITFVSCIVATIGNVYLIITNFEKCQISHPGEFFNFPSSLIWARNYFSLNFFHLHTSKASIKNAQLVSLFMECHAVCIFLPGTRKLPSIQTCEFPPICALLTSHIESSFPEHSRDFDWQTTMSRRARKKTYSRIKCAVFTSQEK